MNKADLIAAVAEKTDLSKKDAERSINAVIDSIVEALKADDKVSLIGFGSFETKTRAAREGRNPQTGAKITIAASKAISFKAGKALKDAVK
ncbi:MAG: HU family DNA-binding protein [Clostridia bacterium]|nr:HU family DNA-binding protein [Clostridia bacterium]